ncbi:MAG: TRAP transporter small permease [Aquisalimonadaceae bacterium]
MSDSKEHEPKPARKAASAGTGGGWRLPMVVFDYADRLFFGFLKLVTGVAFVAMLVSVFSAVILREVVDLPIPWLEEVSRYFLIWSVFLGATVLARQNSHISVDVLRQFMPPLVKKVVDICIAITGISLAGYFSYLATGFTVMAYEFSEMSLSGYLHAWTGYAAVPLGLALAVIAYALWGMDIVRDRVRSPDSVD